MHYCTRRQPTLVLVVVVIDMLLEFAFSRGNWFYRFKEFISTKRCVTAICSVPSSFRSVDKSTRPVGSPSLTEARDHPQGWGPRRTQRFCGVWNVSTTRKVDHSRVYSVLGIISTSHNKQLHRIVPSVMSETTLWRK